MKPVMAAPALLLCLASLRADEGMWTFDNLPTKRIQQAFGSAPDAAWLKRLQLATIRFPGGTGAFVSAEGLVITNHHVGRGAVAQVSTKDRDFIQKGFVATTRDQEIKVPGLTLEILVSQEHVTERVREAAKQAKTEAEAVKARKDAFDRIRGEENRRTGLNCEAVTLYQGGEYWIYRYKRFQDVRLVMAPEAQVASWGGDDDNYSYPRFDLDFCLFRVYEKDAPYHPDAFLPFSQDPLKNGDPTYISGHPGSTFRQWTAAQIRNARDFSLPMQIRSQERLKQAMQAFGATGEEAKRLAIEELKNVENGRKRNQARLNGLMAAGVLEKVQEQEQAFRAAVDKDPHLKAKVAQSWDLISKAVGRERALFQESTLAEFRNAGLLRQALDLVRAHQELSKSMDARLTEFRDEAAAKRRMLSPRPINKALETAKLTAVLQEAKDTLPPTSPLLKALLGSESPATVAKRAIEGTLLHELPTRKKLLEGEAKDVAEAKDPLLDLARRLDPVQRRIRKQVETEVTNVINEHSARLADARFRLYGKEQYPDATFTLRLSYGRVATYANGVGTKAQPFTTLYGLFDRYEGWGGNAAGAEGGQWMLPERWLERKAKMDLATPYNFIYSCDTVGGNSGSPVVNQKGHFVGINFDSVFEGQGGYYVYDAGTKRAVAVDARGILETLNKVYDAGHLAQELLGK